MPDDTPGNFGFFGIAIGGDVAVSGDNDLDDEDNASDDTGKLEEVAQKVEKTFAWGTFVCSGVIDGTKKASGRTGVMSNK